MTTGNATAAPARVSPRAGLRVTDVRVRGFRALVDVHVPLEPGMTVLVGANNSGKTSLLEALDVAVGHADANDADLHVPATGVRGTTATIDVRVEPSSGEEFGDAETQLFGPAVQLADHGPSNVVIRTRIEPGARGGLSKVRYYVKNWSPGPGGDPGQELPERPSSTAIAMLRFYLLDARRDVVVDMARQRSWWGQLTGNLDLPPDDAAAIEQQLADVGARIIGASPTLASVTTSLTGVQGALGATEVSIAPIATRIDDLTKGMDVHLRAAGSAKLSIGQQGMGARSLASLLVFKTFVQARLDGHPDRPPHPITALEEPEAHVHPHGHRTAHGLISSIPGQKLISTHSPFMVAPSDPYALRVFRRRGPEATVSWIDRRRPDGTSTFEPEELEKVRSLVLRRNAEALFASVVVLFEGETEAVVLPVLARTRWEDPDARGMSFLNAEGVMSLPGVVRLLAALGIPWVVLIDGDPGGQKTAETIRQEHGTPGTTLPMVEVRLSTGGTNFDGYLAEVHADILRDAISAEFGPNSLAAYQAQAQGKARKSGAVRNYSGGTGQVQLLTDFMGRNKVRVGRAFAETALARGIIPQAVSELFDHVDAALGSGP